MPVHAPSTCITTRQQNVTDLIFAPFSLSVQTRQQALPTNKPQSTPVTVARRDDNLRRRMVEFDTGRTCAARLLASLGCVHPAVGVAADRSPIWPWGFVGSISHNDYWLAVAVARRTDVRSLGIDVETMIADGAIDEIEVACLSDREIALGATIDMGRAQFVTLCFSAKEAIYKCLYPLVRLYFDFHDAEVEAIEVGTGRLHIRLLRDLSSEFRAGVCLRGAYRFAGTQVFTSFQLPPLPGSAACVC